MATADTIKVLIAKPGLDGHDHGAQVVTLALRDAGMEVVYTGLRQTVESIVRAAIQEDVDVVGLSSMAAAHLTHFPKVVKRLREEGMGHVLVVGGGIIPNEDVSALKAAGISELFGPGTSVGTIASYIRQEVAKRRTQRVG